MGRTLAMGAPSGPPEPSGAHTPLRHSQFESELAQHPNKAWVSRLLSGITHSVDIGYMGPREPIDARNLLSAHTHPHIIHAHLQEVEAGRIRGPFQDRPFPSLRCSGLGVVPKKGNKWRMILHLSAPFGSSINDFISKESFSLRYSSVDDAVRFLITLDTGARMAKADLKSAFHMVPVRPKDWELLGMQWQGAYYFDTCLPFGLRSAPYLFNQYAEALQWMLTTTMGLHTSSTTWMIFSLPGHLSPPSAQPTSTSSCRCVTAWASLWPWTKSRAPLLPSLSLAWNWTQCINRSAYHQRSWRKSLLSYMTGRAAAKPPNGPCYPSLASFPLQPGRFLLVDCSCAGSSH